MKPDISVIQVFVTCLVISLLSPYYCLLSKLDWEGVCGAAPNSGQVEKAVATKDLYM